MAYKILDISKYQPNVDYVKVAAAVDGVILRIGLTYWGAQNMGKDSCFEKHYAGFKAQGCPVGVYYYSAADSVAMAEKEAAYCLELMKGKQFELPIFYDVENSQRQSGLSKELLTQIVDAFCSKVEKAGYYVGFYASTSWLINKMDTAALSKKYTLWKADYRTAYDKTIPCDMHQYTSGATVAGINGRVDMSNCYVDFVSVIKSKGLNGFEKASDGDESKDKHSCKSCDTLKAENSRLKTALKKIKTIVDV
ncbi:MAG: glycoside hydrolase family 25 protein [Oscillospiraceae bacterium]|nr:glycoside hydrolase family 25 protein [Oscillospiraceae bacterium]